MRGFTAAFGLVVAAWFTPLSASAQPAEGTDPPAEGAEEATPLEPTSTLSAAEAGANQRARVHFQSGASYYEAGSYEDAIREWGRAYGLSHRSELLYNLHLAHQGNGDLPEALDYLRRFLDEVENIPNRANLELRVQNLEARIARSAEGDENEPEAASEPEPARPEAPPDAGMAAGPIAGFSIAGAGLLTVVIFGGLTLAEDARLSTACMTPCANGAASDLRTFALVTDIGIGVTLVGAAIGTILLLIGGDDDPGATEAQLTPFFDGRTGGLALRGRL